MKREVVINDDALPKTINEKPNSIIRIRADVCSLEESLNNKGKLAYSCNS